MPTGLPTENALTKAVSDFGIGTYDSSMNSGHGEDDENVEPKGKTLPDDGGPLDPFGPDRLLSYPEDGTSQGKHASKIVARLLTQADVDDFVESDRRQWLAANPGSSPLDYDVWCVEQMVRQAVTGTPGDTDRPPMSRRPADDTKDDVVPTASTSLPSDSDNPSARSDYYDKMQTGTIDQRSEIWPDEDSGAYAGEKTGDTELPGVNKNETSVDDFLGALGNYWSGYEVEDVSGPQGFPTTDFSENVDYDRSDLQDGGKVMAADLSKDNTYDIRRQATNLELAGELTEKFLKEYGKKDLTRRHVMAFLQDAGQPQYLASDVIRCLKHRHKVVVADVLDQFPVTKQASTGFRAGAESLRERMIQLEIANIRNPEVASEFRRCAADLAHVVADLDRFEVGNG